MARPQSPDYQQRRAAIVAEAAHLFARRGFAGASVAELARACRTSKALIYHYFAAKEDILHEVMTAHLDLLVEAAEAARAEATAEARLHALARRFMALYAGAEDSHKVLLNELDRLPPERRSDVVARQRRIIAAVEEMVAELSGDIGALRRPVAMLFFGMINWTHTWFDPAGEIGPDALADTAAALLIDGLRGTKATA
jgi:AcrR family transcriptional regulator